MSESDAVAEFDPRAQHFAGLDVFKGQIDTGHSAPVVLHGESARPSQTATNVENMIVGSDIQLIKETLRGDSPSNMKLVHRSKVFNGHGVRRFS